MTINYSNENYIFDISFKAQNHHDNFDTLELKLKDKNDKLIFKMVYIPNYFDNAMCLTYLSLTNESYKINDIIVSGIYDDDECEHMLINYTYDEVGGWILNICSESENEVLMSIPFLTENDCKFIIRSLRHAIYSQYNLKINELRNEYEEEFNDEESDNKDNVYEKEFKIVIKI